MFVDVNGIKLNYEKTGDGPALIMLHGNSEDLTIFDEASKILSERFTVYCIDTRCHGKSETTSQLHYQDIAEDIKCFIEKLELDRPMLYGFSDGGIVGLLIAIKYPTLLSRLITSGANLSPKGIVFRWYLLLQVGAFFLRTQKLLLMKNEPDITAEMLGRIEIPVNVLAGENDIVRRKETLAIISGIKGSDLRILPKEDHGSYIVHSEKIAHIILDCCSDTSIK